MQIRKRKLDRWDLRVRRRLSCATLRYGYLRKYMRLFPKSQTFVAFSKKQIMGWIFVLPHGEDNIISFFTNARYRKMGVATSLAEEALKHFHSIAVIRWDKASRNTFNRLAERHPSKVTVYDYPKNMPSKCGCDYCNCHS